MIILKGRRSAIFFRKHSKVAFYVKVFCLETHIRFSHLLVGPAAAPRACLWTINLASAAQTRAQIHLRHRLLCKRASARSQGTRTRRGAW